MKDIRARLQEGDPLLHDAELSESESRRLREHILAAQPAPKVSYSALMFPVAAMLLVMAVGSGWWVRSSVPETAPEFTQGRTRQLQFSTPGGTRILWTFNDDLELR